MAEEVSSKAHGSLRRALFQDVPYILDSLWRWVEFRTNRLGTVQFDEPHRYMLRPAWQSGAFVLFALMCLFAIFGPTSDALCAPEESISPTASASSSALCSCSLR